MRIYLPLLAVFTFLTSACTLADGSVVVAPPLATAVSRDTVQPSVAQAVSDPETDTIGEAVRGGAQPELLEFLSPDRQWRAVVAIYPCVEIDEVGSFAYETISLMTIDAGGAQMSSDSQLVNCGGLGAYGLKGLFWSPDSRYFYYNVAREGVPDGCGFWLPPLRRLDAFTGTVEDLGGGVVSPDGVMLATWGDQELALWGIEDSEPVRLPSADPGAVLAALRWSPDGESVAYLVGPSICDPSAAGKTTVVRVHTTSRAQAVLLESESLRIVDLEWRDKDTLVLGAGQDERHLLDVHTGAVSIEPVP